MIKLFTSIALSTTCIVTAQTGFEGNYTYGGYDLSFRDHSSYGYGIKKEVSIGFHSITLTSNTYTGVFNEQSVYRSVQDYITADSGELDSRNLYTAGLDTYSGGGNGTVTPTNNTVLIASDEDGSFPFFFDRGTNLALTISPGDEDGDDYGSVELGLLVSKGSGMSNASLNGNYIRYSIGNSVEGSAEYGWGTTDTLTLDQTVMTFDGVSNYTESGTTWAAKRTINEIPLTNELDTAFTSFGTLYSTNKPLTDAGQYTLSADGSLLLDGQIPCQLSADGQVAVSAVGYGEENLYATLYYTVVVKQPANFDTAPVDAVFYIVETTEEFQQDSESAGVNNNYSGIGRSYVFLKSDGTFTQRIDSWGLENTFDNIFHEENGTNIYFTNGFQTESNEKVIEFSSGTYQITGTGQVFLSFDDGDMGMAQLSENGEFLVFGFSSANDTEAERMFGFGIRRTPPAPADKPVTFTGASMSSTGLVITATCPVNYPFEGLFSENLAEGEWYSGGIIISETGNLQFTDNSVTNSSSGFYKSTFAPW